MIANAYTSTNKTIAALWMAVTGRPDDTMITRQRGTDQIPIPCLRVSWLERGATTSRTDAIVALVQLSIFVGDGDEATANAWAEGITAALGFVPGFGRFGVYDYAIDPPALVGQAEVRPLEGGWVTASDPDPDVIHLAITLDLTFVPLT